MDSEESKVMTQSTPLLLILRAFGVLDRHDCVQTQGRSPRDEVETTGIGRAEGAIHNESPQRIGDKCRATVQPTAQGAP